MALLIKAESTSIPAPLLFQRITPRNGKKFTLEELQRLVGGYVTVVHAFKPWTYEGVRYTSMLINEDGRHLALLVNPAATGILGISTGRPDVLVLVGDVLLIEEGEW